VVYNILDFLYFVGIFDSLQNILSYVNAGTVFLHGYSEVHFIHCKTVIFVSQRKRNVWQS